ncbi:tripartite tricarboxylate transporter substrate binding protein [Clostridium sp. AM58-1XD]|uniref:tripartite tricarboxylate transporter substrate binding protein n=1 Tax=Clostridium sp. AM58-1XD TaxID=2292307 RepID=UPI000E49D0F9|nr:tripartite tricarboxylate transporter substrate binding protein [Clostridium sp. AM58-1XD]RGZ00476.1 tripartite tricarboxylate transporter substrate binding protein [Clostridium sp. AM58-1XD]
MKKMTVKRAAAAVLALTMAAAAMTGCGKKEEVYPSDAIQMIVPVKAGGDTDANARLLAQYMEKELNVSIPVVNVAGSSGTVGMEQVKSAEPDGYTCLFFHTEAMLPEISDLIDYQLDAFKMAGVCLQANTTLLVTHKDSAFKTLPEFLDYAKANSGKVEFGMAVGGYPQLVGLALEKEAGIDLNLVDIGGNADKIAALAGHNTDIINVEYALVKDYLATGEFVALALLSDERNDLFSDIPTAKEQGLDLEFGKFFFAAFPKDTPDEIVNTFSAAMEKVVSNEEFVKAAQDSYALTPVYMNPEEATKYAQEVYENLNSYKELFTAK